MSINFKKLGLEIRARREQRGLSQSHIAEIAGINRTYLGKIERGEVNFSLGVFESIASTLDISPSELLEVCSNE